MSVRHRLSQGRRRGSRSPDSPHRAEASSPNLPNADSRRRALWGFESLRFRNYRLYASSQLVSQTGTWMNRVAQDWLVLDLSHNSSMILGITIALQFVPVALLSLWAGLLADRCDKRMLLFWLQIGQASCALALGVLTLTHLVTLTHVFVVAAVFGCLSAVDMPVRQSFTAELVAREDIANAVGINSVTIQGSRMLGPALAGSVIAWYGIGMVFVLNTMTCAAVVGAVLSMRPDELHVSSRAAKKPRELREGFRYVRHRADLLTVLCLFFLVSAFSSNFELLLAPLAKSTFEKGAAGYGQLASALGIGTLLGAFWATRRRRAPHQAAVITTATVFGLSQIGLAFIPSYEFFFIALIGVGVVMLTLLNMVNTTMQLGTEDFMRGRVMGFYSLALVGGKPIGAPILGAVGELWGARSMLVVSGGVCVVTALVTALWMAHASRPRRA